MSRSTTIESIEHENQFALLKLALATAMDAKEKHWGYFHIRRQETNYFIEIPYMETLRLQKTSDRQGFKAYWGNAHKPAVTTRKRRKTIINRQRQEEKTQRIYEVLYQLDSRSGFRQANLLIAIAIRDRLRATISAESEDELEPLILLSEQVGDR